MKREPLLVVPLVLLAALLVVVATPAKTSAGCRYRAGGLLPDSTCTPGRVNRRVTQSNIGATICKSGWTRTIRPPQSVTYPLKRAAMRAYGVGGLPSSAYEYDHLIPLELGGAPLDTRNLWPEPIRASEGAFAKDAVENRLNRLVCGGKLSLSAARRAIRTDWRTAP